MGKDIRQRVSVAVLRESVPLNLESENDDFPTNHRVGLSSLPAIQLFSRNSLRLAHPPATTRQKTYPRSTPDNIFGDVLKCETSIVAQIDPLERCERSWLVELKKNDCHLETSWNFVYSLFKMLSMILSLLKDRCCDRCCQIIATSPKCSWGREIPWFQGKLGWWNIVIWTDRCLSLSTFVLNPQNPRIPTGFPTEACFGCSWPWSLRVPLVFFFARSTWFNT